MGLSERLRSLDERVGATRFGGGFFRARQPEEDVAVHLRHLAQKGGFGNRLTVDVLVVLDRLTALQKRVEALERQK